MRVLFLLYWQAVAVRAVISLTPRDAKWVILSTTVAKLTPIVARNVYDVLVSVFTPVVFLP